MNQHEPKRILFTGATGGLARQAIEVLLAEGGDNIILAARTAQKADQAIEYLSGMAGPDARTRLIPAAGFDMNDVDAIASAVEALPPQPISTVVLGAGGVIFGAQRQTVEWNSQPFERTVFQNVIGGHIVLSRLRQRGLLGSGARVVVIGGEGARGIDGFIDKPEFSSPDELADWVLARKPDNKYNAFNAMGISKLIAALWTRKLAVLAKGELEPVWFSPGFTYGTGGTDGLPTAQRLFMQLVVFRIMALFGKVQSPSAGGRKLADCIQGKVGAAGDIIGAPAGKSIGALVDQRPMNANIDDTGLQDAFWAILEEHFGRW